MSISCAQRAVNAATTLELSADSPRSASTSASAWYPK